MSAFKLILKRLSIKTVLITALIFLFAPTIKGQDSVFSIRPYTIITDTITKADTTYIIDTIINTYQYIITDTIYKDEDRDIIKEITDKNHKLEGTLRVTLNQLAITHWAAGGESNGSGNIYSNITYTYNRELFKYVINGIFAYGMSNYTKDKRYEKSEDRCELSMTMTNNNNNNQKQNRRDRFKAH